MASDLETKIYDLSVIIPGRNEEFMNRTIQDLLEHIKGNTEIIAVLDGYKPEPPLDQVDERVTVIYNPESKGQRAAANQAARYSRSKYLMKVDAHCAFADGFDVSMMEAYKEVAEKKLYGIEDPDTVVMVPTMKNLHAFSWVCPDGHTRYQGPSGPCKECGKPTTKDICWIAKPSPNSNAYRFDKTMHFQYWNDWAYRQKGDITETMSIQGSAFMCTKKHWFDVDICSETDFSSWGQQGVEVACKTWLSGGAVLVNRKTWYAHMFRTQGGDFSFPYPNPQSKVNENRQKTRELFANDNWPGAKRKFQWLLDKFNPPGWKITKGVIYYTDGSLEGTEIGEKCKNQLLKATKEKGITTTVSSLGKRLQWGDRSVYFPSLKRSYETMFKQILGALEKSQDDIIFFAEHDVLYHPSHFDFMPDNKETFYYNNNLWFMRHDDGYAIKHKGWSLSQLCGYRDSLIAHFKERVARIEKEGFDRKMGFEPFTHGRVKWENTFAFGEWTSEKPNIDIRHGKNPTGQRWSKDQIRNEKFKEGWQDTYDIPGWGKKSDFWEKLK